MPQYTSNAAKQRAYRERKKRDLFLSNDFFVTRALGEIKREKVRQGMLEIFEWFYDETKSPEAVQRLAVQVYAFTSVVNIANKWLEPDFEREERR